MKQLSEWFKKINSYYLINVTMKLKLKINSSNWFSIHFVNYEDFNAEKSWKL